MQETNYSALFIFCSNDTIVDFDIDTEPYDENWILYYSKLSGDGYSLENYRTINTTEGYVNVIHPKGINTQLIYTGLCFVNDFNLFWKAMRSKNAINIGEVYGLNALSRVKAVHCNKWFDCGSINGVEIAREYFKSTFNILNKQNEAIWFRNDKIIKYHNDSKFISDRLERTKFLPQELIPSIINFKKHHFTYKKIEGDVISSVLTHPLLP